MATFNLSDNDNGKTIKAVKDDKVIITLKWVPASGFFWSEAETTAAHLEEIKHEGDNPTPGGVAFVTFKFRITQSGNIGLHLARPWAETEPPEKWFMVTIGE